MRTDSAFEILVRGQEPRVQDVDVHALARPGRLEPGVEGQRSLVDAIQPVFFFFVWWGGAMNNEWGRGQDQFDIGS